MADDMLVLDLRSGPRGALRDGMAGIRRAFRVIDKAAGGGMRGRAGQDVGRQMADCDKSRTPGSSLADPPGSSVT